MSRGIFAPIFVGLFADSVLCSGVKAWETHLGLCEGLEVKEGENQASSKGIKKVSVK